MLITVNTCLIVLGSDNCKGHVWLTSFFYTHRTFLWTSCTVKGDVLKETTPMKTEIFHHRMTVISLNPFVLTCNDITVNAFTHRSCCHLVIVIATSENINWNCVCQKGCEIQDACNSIKHQQLREWSEKRTWHMVHSMVQSNVSH